MIAREWLVTARGSNTDGRYRSVGEPLGVDDLTRTHGGNPGQRIPRVGALHRPLRAVVRPLVPTLRRASGRLARPPAEVFLAVARNLGRYVHTPGQAAFRGWLRAIVRNKLIDHWRKQSPTPNMRAVAELSAPDAGADPAEGSLEDQLLFRRALELIRTDFQPASWQAFWLVAVEDRNPVDVAAELGLTLNAVYLAKSRVLRRLREEFADLLDDAPPPIPPTG